MKKEGTSKKIQIQTQIDFSTDEDTEKCMRFSPEKAAFYQDFGKLLDEMRKVFDD